VESGHWSQAKFHARNWGVTTAAPPQKIGRIRIKKSRFESATKFLLQEGNIYSLAFGTTSHRLDDGTTIELPTKARESLIKELYDEYKKAITREDAAAPNAMSRSAFSNCAKLAAAKDPKDLAVLDHTAMRHGKKAFLKRRSELCLLAALSPLAASQSQVLESNINVVKAPLVTVWFK
jgi:hypothetical protein